WADLLQVAADWHDQMVYHGDNHFTAHVLEFASGRRIYCVSSNPNALAGKRGHVKLDEFALHENQPLLYRVAKPVTQWGGTLSLISTHRGPNTLFNQIITKIKGEGRTEKGECRTAREADSSLSLIPYHFSAPW